MPVALTDVTPMNKDIKVYLLILAVLSPLAMPDGARGQALGEFAGVNAGVAGMGAGVAASMGNGALVRRTYESAAQAQQAMMAQNQAVEQYFKMGNQFEMKKQWENAEKAFTYVLQVIARRDGAGSPKSVPALKHLAAISQQQNRLDQAISYQKTVLAFTKAAKVPDKIAIVEESVNLSKILIKKAEYSLAEPIMRESVALAKQTTMPRSDYQTTLQVYGRVLRQLNRQEEAQAIEAELLPPSTGATPATNPVTTTATTTTSTAAASVPNSAATMLTIAPPPAATTTSNTNGSGSAGSGAATSGTTEATGSTSVSTSTTEGTSVTSAQPAVTQAEPTESWKPANSEPEPTPMPMPMPGAYSAPDPATVSKTAAPTSPPANTEAAAPSTAPAAPKQSSAAPLDIPEPQPMPMPIALPDGSTIPAHK